MWFMLYSMDHPRHRKCESLENDTGGIAAIEADAASMDHAANGILAEVGFGVANR